MYVRTDSVSLRARTRDLSSNCLWDGVMAPCVPICPGSGHLCAHTFRVCIDVGFGHAQKGHFESVCMYVCSYPPSAKLEWCGQAVGMYLLIART